MSPNPERAPILGMRLLVRWNRCALWGAHVRESSVQRRAVRRDACAWGASRRTHGEGTEVFQETGRRECVLWATASSYVMARGGGAPLAAPCPSMPWPVNMHSRSEKSCASLASFRGRRENPAELAVLLSRLDDDTRNARRAALSLDRCPTEDSQSSGLVFALERAKGHDGTREGANSWVGPCGLGGASEDGDLFKKTFSLPISNSAYGGSSSLTFATPPRGNWHLREREREKGLGGFSRRSPPEAAALAPRRIRTILDEDGRALQPRSRRVVSRRAHRAGSPRGRHQILRTEDRSCYSPTLFTKFRCVAIPRKTCLC